MDLTKVSVTCSYCSFFHRHTGSVLLYWETRTVQQLKKIKKIWTLANAFDFFFLIKVLDFSPKEDFFFWSGTVSSILLLRLTTESVHVTQQL